MDASVERCRDVCGNKETVFDERNICFYLDDCMNYIAL